MSGGLHSDNDSEFIGHEPCPKCGSEDNLGRYSDGHGHCFGCGHYEHGDGEPAVSKKGKRVEGLLTGEVKALTKRGISEDTCRHFGYLIGKSSKGKSCHIAQYRDEDNIVVAQKLRFPDKDEGMPWKGEPKSALPLFGQWLWRDTGKMVVVTEGEIDAMSVSQLQGNKWPVVSVKNGAQGANKDIAKAVKWLEQFETVVFMLDNDEPGIEAAKACAQVLSPGKAKIATLPLKDANDMLVAGRGKEVIDAIWSAKEYRPDGVIFLDDIEEEIMTPTEMGLPWWNETLTEATFGRRWGECVGLGAGTGVGKTDFVTQQIVFDVTVLKEKVGLFFLEQPPKETGQRLAGKFAGKRFHVPNTGWTPDELRDAVKQVKGNRSIALYNHFGQCDWEQIKSHIRYLNKAHGIRIFYLDHLTALAAGTSNEKEELERITAEISGLCQELGIWLLFISHLSTPEGKSHEEGGRVMIRHFKGSRAIGFWSHFMFGLERDQQAEDERDRQTTTFRVLKDRYTGQATGKTILLGYDQESGRLHETTGEFDQDGPGFPDDDVPF
jgi:twinkle protein